MPEQQLFELTNRARLAAHLPILKWNGRLAQAARVRSSAARDAGGASSLPEGIQDPFDTTTVSVAVNIARAPNVDDAHQAFMDNPRQREHILSTSDNEVGIGVVETSDGNGVFVTEAFVRSVPRVDPDRVAAKIAGELVAGGAIEDNPDLTSIAQKFAIGLATGRSREEVWPSVSSQLDGVKRHYTRIRSTVTRVADVATVHSADLLGNSHADVVGVGVAQATHAEFGNGLVWIVVLSGERLLCPPGEVCGK